jgi:hypothetical protein
MEVRRRLLPLLFIAIGAAFYFTLAPHWPADQHVRIVLGERAPRVEEVTLRCATSERSSSDDWLREVTFRYAKGSAPRIVSYEPRLVRGDYLVEVEIHSDDGRVVTLDRHVTLAGGTTSIDLPEASVLRDARVP